MGASAVAGIAVKLRDPFPPHRALASAKVPAIDYGFMLMRSGSAQFTVSRADDNSPYSWAQGNMVSVERSDGLLPWYGFITNRQLDSESGSAQITAVDYAGALFERAATPKDWPQEKKSAGEWVRSLGLWANRGRPPLLVDVRGVIGGGPVQFAPAAESFTSLLDTMARSADWEWAVRYEGIDGPQHRAALVFSERVGRDLSRQVVFQEGRHFARARMTEDAQGVLENAIALGGSGAVSGRAAVAVNPSSTGAPGVDGFPLIGLKTTPSSPALAGTRVAIEQAVTNKEALAKMAQNLHHAADSVVEQVSFTIAETETDMRLLEVGSLYGVRFADLSLGLAVHRKVRLIALKLSTDGQHDIEAEVLSSAA